MCLNEKFLTLNISRFTVFALGDSMLIFSLQVILELIVIPKYLTYCIATSLMSSLSM